MASGPAMLTAVGRPAWRRAVAPLTTASGPVPRALALAATSVPAPTTVPLAWVLALVSVSVPGPDLVTVPMPLPLTVDDTVPVAPAATSNWATARVPPASVT